VKHARHSICATISHPDDAIGTKPMSSPSTCMQTGHDQAVAIEEKFRFFSLVEEDASLDDELMLFKSQLWLFFCV
jgi:hypothetical protein